MPGLQTANVANYDFGAPAASTEILTFRVKDNWGGKLDLTFEAKEAIADLSVSAKVSPDNDTKAALTAANNLVVITNATVARGTTKEYTIALRRGVDKYVHILASGGARGRLQIRGGEKLEIVSI